MPKSLRRPVLATVGVIAVVLGFTLGPIGSSGAQQAGDVKIHDITDTISDSHDNPKPCDPVLVSFNFAVGEQYTYEFLTQPGGVSVLGPTTVTVSVDPQQEPSSGDFRPPLVKGEQYKLVWDLGATIGSGPKSKVFQIPSDCVDPPTPPAPSVAAESVVRAPQFTG